MLVVIFTLLGALLQGQHVMKTIGSGIISTELTYTAIGVALICSGIFVTLATFYRIPTSTSQAIVGGIMGIGLATGAPVNYGKLITIAQSWVLCPLLVLGVAYLLSLLLNYVLNRLTMSSLMVQNALGRLAILSSCYVAYSMGANNAGNAVGPIANLDLVHPKLLLLIGGIAITLGAATYGKKVADTVGKGITPLDLPSAFIAQFSSAFGLHFFSLLGIPVSTSSAIVGAVVGVGLSKGIKNIRKKTIITIFTGWVLTPCLAGCATYIAYKMITTYAPLQ
jgi:phosphate/sulfate permease